jgi:phage baseplate assembly protein W
MNVHFPYSFDERGRTAGATDDAHIRELIELVLFTQAGERVNRPDFGSGVLQIVFSGNSPEAAATIQFLVQGALQQWLSEWITVDQVEARSEDATLFITIGYTNRRTQVHETIELVHGAPT